MFAGLFSSNSAKDNASVKASPQRRLSTTATPKPPVIVRKPPFPHPLPHTKIRVQCSEDGLVLSGLRSKKSSYSSRSTLVSFGKAASVSVLEDYTATSDKNVATYTCYGCLGLLRLFNESYVLLITSRSSVGKYAGMSNKRIYCLTGVTAVPVSTPSVAREAIQTLVTASRSRSKKPTSGESSDTSSTSSASQSSSSDYESDSSRGDVTVDLSNLAEVSKHDIEQDPEKLDAAIVTQTASETNLSSPELQSTSAPTEPSDRRKIERPVVTGLGRFFWSYKNRPDQEETEDLVNWTETASSPIAPSLSDSQAKAGTSTTAQLPEPTQKTASDTESLKSLDKKILRELIVEFTSGGFFFSQDFDLTTCMQTKWGALSDELQQARSQPRAHRPVSAEHTQQDSRHTHKQKADIRRDEPRISEPLCHRADRRFWYNRWLSKDLLDAGAPEFITVLMQGFVQRRRVSLSPAKDGAIPTKIEKGSDATVTHMPVEMLIISRRSVERPGLRYQRRGVNDAGGVANFVETEFIVAIRIEGREHLTSYVQTRGSIPLYWSQSPWSLKPIPVLDRAEEDNSRALEKHFERQVKTYFGAVHIVNLAETSGKEGVLVAAYRNGVANLGRPEVIYNEWDFHHMCKGMRYERISLLLEQLAPQIAHMTSFWLLDGEVLAKQRGVMRVNCMDCLDRTNVVESALARKHVISVLEHLGVHGLSATSQESLDVAFNELWANNGDAISREYAGTSALKGDFVRSGRRNWLGQFNDATNSVARYWQNTILDFFKQAMIDYVLGINTNAFLEFSEKMQASDPGEITRLSNIRQAAIDTAAAAVLADEERKLYGWTLISPSTFGQIRDTSFEEKILILTTKALYACSFEYTLQKVRDFVRIPLGQIVGMRQGEYILSALDPAARNIEENYGFCIRYLPAGVTERSRTYSIRNTAPVGALADMNADNGTSIEDSSEIAFKAVRKDLVRDLDQVTSPTTVTSRVQVLDIVDHIRQACEDIGATTPGDSTFVEEAPIVSLAEAKAQVSLLDRLNYELKNMIWL